MKRNLQDIDKLFRDGLEDHIEPAPRGVWDAVNNDLDKKQALLFRQKYFRLRKLALVLLLFIFSGIVAVFYFSRPGIHHTGIAQKQTTTITGNSHQGINASGKKSAPEEKISTGHNAQTSKASNARVPVEKMNATELPPPTKQPAANQQQYLKDAVPLKPGTSAPVEMAGNRTAVLKDFRISTPINNNELESVAAGSINNHLAVTKPRSDKHHAIARNQLPVLQSSNRPSTAAAGSNVKDYFVSGEVAANDNGIQHILQNKDATNKLSSSYEAGTKKTAAGLTAYLHQPALLLPALALPAPGPFVAIEKAPWLSSIIQNDSLKKAIAASKKKTVSRHTISIMAFVAPNHSFTRLENDDRLAGPGRNKYAAERDERQGTSYSAGMLVNYGITKGLILQSGLVFSSAKTNISPKVIYARPDNSGHTRYEFNCASGYSYISPKTGQQPAVGDSIQVIGSSSTITYISIPFALNYVWQRGRFLLKPGMGVSVNLLAGGSSATRIGNIPDNQKEIASITGLKKAYVDGSIGFGAEWMLNRKIAIGVRPLLRMALTSINKETPVKTYQNYLSLETGLKINL